MNKVLLALVLCLATTPAAIAQQSSGIIDPCVSTFSLHSGVSPCPLLVCPQGDTPSFIDQGWWLEIYLLDVNGTPAPPTLGADFWLVDCDPLNDAVLCGGAGSSNADSTTNAATGRTTMSLSVLIGGGCADGMAVVAGGLVVQDSLTSCSTDKCAPIWLRSPDINGSLTVDLVDLSIFASSFPPQPFDSCCDLNLDGLVGLQDLSAFAFHFGPPGHTCN